MLLARSLWLFGVTLGLGACTSRATLPPQHPGPGPDSTKEGATSVHEAKDPVPPDVVERAAAPFVGVRANGGELISPDGLLDELSRADLVCVGEEHSDALSHFAQLVVLTGLVERSAMNGRELGLGLEMVARPEQRLLDGYGRFELEEDQFLKESRWQERWGWDFAYYRPQLELSRHRGLALVALNAPRPLTRAVAHHGLAALPRDLEKKLPELDLGDRDHRAWFDETMKAHPHGNPENMYAAQVVWDETMAESAARWLAGRLPGRQLVVLAGTGHCRAEAIPRRVTRRTPARVVSVRAVAQGGKEDVKAALEGFDFVMAFDAPSAT